MENKITKVALVCRALFAMLAVQVVIIAVNVVALFIVDDHAGLFIASYDIIDDKVVQTNTPWDIEKACIITQFVMLFGISAVLTWLLRTRVHALSFIGGLLGIVLFGVLLTVFVENSKVALSLIVVALCLSLVFSMCLAVYAALGKHFTAHKIIVMTTIVVFLPVAVYIMLMIMFFWGLSVATH